MRLFSRMRDPHHIWDFPVPEGMHASSTDDLYTLRRGGLNLMFEVRRTGEIKVWYRMFHAADRVAIQTMLEDLHLAFPVHHQNMWMKVKR